MATTKVKKKRSAHGNGTAGNGLGSTAGFVALSLLTAPHEAPTPRPEDGPPCHVCTARCCKYFALEIDAPRARADFDQIRWFLMHEGIAVWVEDGDWYLEVRTVCRHLQPDNSCGIYETRPEVCREYGTKKDPCEFFTDDLEYDLHFESDTQFDAWLAKREQERKSRKKLKQRQAA